MKGFPNHDGIERAQEEKADAAMFFLADQPFITVLMIEELIACMEKNPACNYVATPGETLHVPPILFSSSMFPVLLTLREEVGTSVFLQNIALDLGEQFPCEDCGFLFGMDTKDGYK